MSTKAKDVDLIDRDETAAMVGVNPRTLDKWRMAGGGPDYYQLGQRILYSRDDVEKWDEMGRPTAGIRPVPEKKEAPGDVKALKYVLENSPATGTEKVILCAIAFERHDLTMDEIAHIGNVTRRTAERAVANLVKMGELEVQRGKGGGDDVPTAYRPNKYRILTRPRR